LSTIFLKTSKPTKLNALPSFLQQNKL
jgi:hypothetical protein